MKQPRLYFLFLGLLLLAACHQDPAPEFHFDYFGMEEDRYVIYDVTEITHDKALGLHETLNYQLRTLWGDTVIDNEGRVAREFLRYERASSADPWQLTDVWTGIISGIRAELTVENQRVVKLVFAPTLSKSWDANAYNTYDPLDCYYREIHQDTLINGISLDPTVTVEQYTFTTLIDSVRMYEVYSKPMGLVYKHSRDNHYQFGSNEVNIGKELYYRFVSTGFVQ